MNRYYRLTLTVVVIYVFAGVNAAVAFWSWRLYDLSIVALPSLQIAEAFLLGIWIVNSSQSVKWRLTVSALASVAMFAVALSWLPLSPGDRINWLKVLVLPYFLALAGTTLLFYLLPVRIRSVSPKHSPQSISDRQQFSIRWVMSLMLLVGLLITIFTHFGNDWRYLYWMYRSAGDFAQLVGAGIAIMLTCLPLPYFLLSPRRFACSISLLYCLATTLVIWPLLIEHYFDCLWLHYVNFDDEYWNELALLVGSTCGTVVLITALTLSVVRSRGFRLVRLPIEVAIPASSAVGA